MMGGSALDHWPLIHSRLWLTLSVRCTDREIVRAPSTVVYYYTFLSDNKCTQQLIDQFCY